MFDTFKLSTTSAIASCLTPLTFPDVCNRRKAHNVLPVKLHNGKDTGFNVSCADRVSGGFIGKPEQLPHNGDAPSCQRGQAGSRCFMRKHEHDASTGLKPLWCRSGCFMRKHEHDAHGAPEVGFVSDSLGVAI